MSNFDAVALAAWTAARDVHSHAVTFNQAGDVVYDPAYGENSGSDGTATAVQCIVCPQGRARTYALDVAVEIYDLMVQALSSELPAEPRVGETVTYNGDDYIIESVSPFPFGVVECGVKGART